MECKVPFELQCNTPSYDLTCNLYSITTNQAAIIALFRVVNRYIGTLGLIRACFRIIRAPVICDQHELCMMRCGMAPPPR
jgi:hypothetical protein